jgi:hypothetical protein
METILLTKISEIDGTTTTIVLTKEVDGTSDVIIGGGGVVTGK